jgi:hypothetical protein
MTATVGGVWDSLLAEGRPWWITANSDVHNVYGDTLRLGRFAVGESFETVGHVPDPVEGGRPLVAHNDFFPGCYSRTHVGCTGFGYGQVMAGLRAGRVWVDHGALLDGLDVRVREPGADGRPVVLGGVLDVRPGATVDLDVTIDPASRPNYHGDVPALARVDVIRGFVEGTVRDRDACLAPATRVVRSYDVGGHHEAITLTMRFRDVERSFYLRLRGSDGHRSAPGLRGSAVDPLGPAADLPGQADPWQDLWFYTNPVFVDVRDG